MTNDDDLLRLVPLIAPCGACCSCLRLRAPPRAGRSAKLGVVNVPTNYRNFTPIKDPFRHTTRHERRA